MAGPGTVLAIIFSHESKIVIQVEESRYGDVAVGQPVSIRVDAYADRTFAGEVSAIADLRLRQAHGAGHRPAHGRGG